MRRLLLLPVMLLSGSAVFAGSTSTDWTIWSPRTEIAPAGALDEKQYRSGPDSLRLAGDGNAGVFGGWRRTQPGIEPGAWYRLTAWRRVEGVEHPDRHTVARLSWRTSKGKGAGREEYAAAGETREGWQQVTAEAPAPEEAAEAVVQLYLVNAADGRVWWDDVSLEKIPAPEARPVNVVSVNLRPRRTGSPDASMQRFLDFSSDKVGKQADLILLPEGITVVGSGASYAEAAELIPGPSTEKLGALARAKQSYVAAGLIERDGRTLYNTAVLLDRQGRLAGKYRKVYLPREEFEGGLTPGDEYPVFETDFGKVGMMICWDVQYADPARALALAGAELILMPIWGGNETLAAARAIENHVFLAASGYDHPTYVMDPMGEMLSKAPEEGSLAETTIDLNRRYTWPWLGEMRGRFFHELRSDVEVDRR